MEYKAQKTTCPDDYVLFLIVDSTDVNEKLVRIKQNIGIVSLKDLQNQIIDAQTKITAIKSLGV